MKTGQLATRLGVSTSTIRLWCSEYRHYLSAGAVGSPARQTRDLDTHDCLVLATVSDLKGQGLTRAQIVEALDGGRLVDALPAAPSPAEKEARENVALVVRPEYERALDRVHALEVEKAEIRELYNQAVITLQEANDRIAKLEREIGTAQGRAQELEKTTRLIVALVLGLSIIVALAVVFLAVRAG